MEGRRLADSHFAHFKQLTFLILKRQNRQAIMVSLPVLICFAVDY
jgi:hypothetical protein